MDAYKNCIKVIKEETEQYYLYKLKTHVHKNTVC